MPRERRRDDELGPGPEKRVLKTRSVDRPEARVCPTGEICGLENAADGLAADGLAADGGVGVGTNGTEAAAEARPETTTEDMPTTPAQAPAPAPAPPKKTQAVVAAARTERAVTRPCKAIRTN